MYFQQILPRIIGLISFLTIISCATPQAFVDYDEEANFGKYSTYNFYAPETLLDVAEEDTIMGFIEENLQAKGLKSELIAKFSIDFFVEFVEIDSPIVFDTGYVAANPSSTYMTLTISFADALTSELFWQAVVERKVSRYISEEDRIALYKEFIDLALENYPPKPGGEKPALQSTSPPDATPQGN